MRSVVVALLSLCLSLVPVSARAGSPSDICGNCSSNGFDSALSDDTRIFRATMLDMHNAERRQWHVPPLKWNETLASDARMHAARLARLGRMEHGSEQTGSRPVGENLWMGTRGAYAYGDMVGSFLDERRFYVARAIPNISRTGRWSDAAHYSQVIWRTTTSVGCGVASGRDFDVLVCRYDPAGNIVGRTADDDRGFDAPDVRMASNGRRLLSSR